MTLQETRDKYEATLTDETKDRASKIRINGGKLFLKECVANGEFEGDIKEAIQAVAGGGATRAASSPRALQLAELVEAGQMSNVECFMNFNKGPAEMRDLMRHAIKELPADERVWITFNVGGGNIYEVVSIGADVPEGWTGYMPSDDNGEL